MRPFGHYYFYMVKGQRVSKEIYEAEKISSISDREIGTLEERLPPYPHKINIGISRTDWVNHG